MRTMFLTIPIKALFIKSRASKRVPYGPAARLPAAMPSPHPLSTDGVLVAGICPAP